MQNVQLCNGETRKNHQQGNGRQKILQRNLLSSVFHWQHVAKIWDVRIRPKKVSLNALRA